MIQWGSAYSSSKGTKDVTYNPAFNTFALVFRGCTNAYDGYINGSQWLPVTSMSATGFSLYVDDSVNWYWMAIGK